MAWPGWDEYVPPVGAPRKSAPPKSPMISARPREKANDLPRAQTAPAPPKKSKYGAVKTTVDGIVFDSKKEAARYQELKLREKAGEIRAIGLQPSFSLQAAQSSGATWSSGVGVYRADFSYYDLRTKQIVVEDVKGFKTPLYRWKKKHVEAQYGITVIEV